MEQLAVDLTFETQENGSNVHAINPLEVHIIENTTDQTHAIFYRNQLLAQYQLHDNYTRNIVIVQLHQCHQVSQKTLSQVFNLTVQHISTLVCQYREKGSEGIQNRLSVRIGKQTDLYCGGKTHQKKVWRSTEFTTHQLLVARRRTEKTGTTEKNE